MKERTESVTENVSRAVSDFLYGISVWFHQHIGSKLKRKGEMNSRKREERIFLTVILAWPVLHFIVFYIIMNLNSIILAFQSYDADMNVTFAGLENFRNVIHDLQGKPQLKIATINSLIMFVTSLVIGLPLTLIFSYFIYKKVRGYRTFQFVLFLPSIFSGLVLSLVFKIFVEGPLPALLRAMGIQNVPNFLIDTKWAFPTVLFYSIFTGFATGMILYSNAMSRIPDELIEYGRLEGIGMFREMWNIVIPLIWPTLTTMMVTGVAGIFANGGPIYMMYGDQAPDYLYNLGYYLFIQVISRNSTMASYPYAAAAGLLMTACAAPLTLLVKHLMETYGPEAEY